MAQEFFGLSPKELAKLRRLFASRSIMDVDDLEARLEYLEQKLRDASNNNF